MTHSLKWLMTSIVIGCCIGDFIERNGIDIALRILSE